MVLREQEEREVQDVEAEQPESDYVVPAEEEEVIEWPSNERLEHYKRGGRD